MSTKTRSHWIHDKTQAEATGGMISSRHPLSAEAGLEILKAGGSAVDAVIAASFAESVVQPAASTIGGGGIFTVRRPNGDAHGINYMWETPAAATADMFPIEGVPQRGLFGWSGVKDNANEIGGLAPAIPGSVAGLVKAAETYGRLPLAQVMAPAIRLAGEGFEMDWYGSLMAGMHLDILKRFPTTARMLLRDGEFPYRPNMIGKADLCRQPALAKTLEAIAAGGAKAFYTGEIARSLVDAVRQYGGIFSLEDFEQYEPTVRDQVEIFYRGHKVQGEPSGFTIYTQVLNVLSHFNFAKFDVMSSERLHVFIEVMRHCWRDKNLVWPDARRLDGPIAVLSTPEYAAALAKRIDTKKRADLPSLLDDHAPAAPTGETKTVHIGAIDGEGCLASLTETVIGNYGSFIMSETGVLLNNGMIGYAPVPGQPNSITPRKRGTSYISPLHVSNLTDGAVMTLGCSGGSKIPTSLLQIISYIVDHGMSPQQAVSFPRIDFEGDLVVLDTRFGEATAAALRSLGHSVELRAEELSTFEFGNPCVIARDADGVIRAGVNPYQATVAIGFDRA